MSEFDFSSETWDAPCWDGIRDELFEPLYYSTGDSPFILGDVQAIGKLQCVDCANNWPEDVASEQSVESTHGTPEVAFEDETVTSDTALNNKWVCMSCDTDNFEFDGSTCTKCGFDEFVPLLEGVRDSEPVAKHSGHFGSKQAYKQAVRTVQPVMTSKTDAVSSPLAAADIGEAVASSEVMALGIPPQTTIPVVQVYTIVDATTPSTTKPLKKCKRKRNVAAPNSRIPKGAKVQLQKTGKWLVRMDYNGQKQKYIGRFQHEAEARAAAALCEADPSAFFEGKKTAKKKARIKL
jgi:hypothetical protein